VRPSPTAAPTVTPTATPLSQAALAADLKALVLRQLPLTPTPDPKRPRLLPGIVEVAAIPLGVGKDGRPLWAAYSIGGRAFDPIQNHFVAVYARGVSTWQVLARVDMENPDYVDEGSVAVAALEPSRIWIQVESGVGAHGGCFDLLSFDGKVLRDEVSHCNSRPGEVAYLTDLNGDGQNEVVLDDTDEYVFCYACGVRLVRYRVLRWDGARLTEVKLAPAPESAPAGLRRLTNRAVVLAQAGLWKDAQATISQAAALGTKDDVAEWDAALIRLTADGRADEARLGPYPVLDKVFYGDYAAALDVMRPYTPAQIFGPASPLVDGTPAEGMSEQLAQHMSAATTAAINAQPDLAAAYFLRGWANSVAKPGSPDALADVQKAASLDPKEPLYGQCLAYLRKPG
jgi:hypothetical protein